MKPQKIIGTCMILLFIAGAYFPFFHELGTLSIRPWDESRNAVNAIEMADGGSLIAPTFDGLPENWNTKPPLLFWMQAGFMKIVGHNEWAVRLPSAMAAVATCLMLLFWVGNLARSRPAGWLSGMVLMTATGYFHWHGARQGDFDVMLICWLVFYSLAWFQFLHGPIEEQKKWLFLTLLGVFLAVFTKAVAGFFLLPGLFIYTLAIGKMRLVLRQKEFYIYAGSFLLLLVLYLGIRESTVPGFLKSLNKHELMGRFFGVTENSPGPFVMYFENWWKERFDPWNLWLMVGALGILIFGDREKRRLGLYALVLGGTFLLMVSFSKTKMLWYDLPAYAFAAMIIGLGVVSILEKIIGWGLSFGKGPLDLLQVGLIWVVVLLLSIAPYRQIVQQVAVPVEDGNEREQFGHFISYLSKTRPELKSYTAINKEYNAGLLFYRHQARIEHGVTIGKKMVGKHNFTEGEMGVVCHQDLFEGLKSTYSVAVVDSQSYSIAFGNRKCTCRLIEFGP